MKGIILIGKSPTRKIKIFLYSIKKGIETTERSNPIKFNDPMQQTFFVLFGTKKTTVVLKILLQTPSPRTEEFHP
jgi:hypothetical protein